ncbi:MAG TPA: organic hydroperoxide resistance protein [Nakamurella sp.]
MTSPTRVVYSTTAVSTGNGRNGRARTTDGVLDLELTSPRPNAGPGDPTNPEQLFAAGYSACFNSALKNLAKAAGVDSDGSSVSVEVGLVKGEAGFALRAAITGHLPGVDREVAADLLEQAHQRCPYSKAIRGNMEVALAVG